MNEIKLRFHEARFEECFQDFLEELESNIHLYKDIEIINDYTNGCMGSVIVWEGFNEQENQWIIKNGFEIQFLIGLVILIKKYHIIMINFCKMSNYMNQKRCLKYVFDEVMEEIECNRITKSVIEKPNKNQLPEKLDCFDFNNLKLECNKLNNEVEKIKLINDRLFDFSMWQRQYDILIYDRDIGQYFEYTHLYYFNFEELCSIELKRIEKQLEIENKYKTPKAVVTNQKVNQNSNNEKYYTWNTSGTDLLELVVALYKNNCFQRKDGKPIKRVELTEYFLDLFSVEIKDVEGSLTRATNRKINKTPFLDSLKIAFANYAVDKEGKLQKRK